MLYLNVDFAWVESKATEGGANVVHRHGTGVAAVHNKHLVHFIV